MSWPPHLSHFRRTLWQSEVVHLLQVFGRRLGMITSHRMLSLPDHRRYPMKPLSSWFFWILPPCFRGLTTTHRQTPTLYLQCRHRQTLLESMSFLSAPFPSLLFLSFLQRSAVNWRTSSAAHGAQIIVEIFKPCCGTMVWWSSPSHDNSTTRFIVQTLMTRITGTSYSRFTLYFLRTFLRFYNNLNYNIWLQLNHKLR